VLRLYGITLAVVAVVVGGVPLAATAAPNAVPGYDAEYCGESAYLALHVGDSGQLQTCFANTGTVSWVNGSASEVVLSVCVDTPAPQYFACNVLSPYGDWASGWTTARIYAAAPIAAVTPGQNVFYRYAVKVPTGTSAGDYYFRGELVLRATGVPIHPVGYYHVIRVIP